MRVAIYQTAVDYVRVGEAAASLGVSDRTIRRWIRAGRLPVVRPGRDFLIPATAYKEFLEKNTIPIQGYILAGDLAEEKPAATFAETEMIGSTSTPLPAPVTTPPDAAAASAIMERGLGLLDRKRHW